MTGPTSSASRLPGAPRAGLTGHRLVALGGSPFAPTAPALAVAVVFGLGCLVWLAAGDALPGGRWIVVHMFTLGVLTPLLWAFSRHFAVRLTSGEPRVGRLPAMLVATVSLAVFVLGMLTGRVTGAHLPLAVATGGIMIVVGWNVVVLRLLRRRSPRARFAWVLRQYEHAHLAFLAAAALGGALGAGWIPAAWFGAIRAAHIHLNVLGWVGLAVLATLVVFGPALLRARIEPGADARAARVLPWATLGLVAAAAGLLLAGTPVAAWARGVAVAGLIAYAVGVVVVVAPLFRTSRRHDRSPLRWSVLAVTVWFPLMVVADVVVVATAARGWEPVLGLGLFIGVFVQLVLAVLLHVAPMLRGRDLAARDLLLRRVERLALGRTLVLNLGVLVLVLGGSASRLGLSDGAWTTRTGWVLVGAGVAAHLVVALWPPGASDHGRARAGVAARSRAGSEPEASATTLRSGQP